jgi:cystathionine beta-lyase
VTALETRLVHPPPIEGEPAGATSTPLYQTATFAIAGDPASARWDYSRSGNPTRDVLEAQLAALDGASRALAYTSGLAALAAVFSLARPGQQIVVGDDLYGGTTRLLHRLESRSGIVVRPVDTRSPAAVTEAIDLHPTALVLVETPSNPRLRPTDVAAIAEVTARRGVLLAVDNSMLSPYLYRPLDDGADLAVQSATKALGGHGDLTAGVVTTRRETVASELAFARNADGTALAPFPCWLLLRGLETLAVRVDRQLVNTRAVLALLERHPAVERLHVPGNGPQPPVVSFETGDVAASRRLVAAARLFRTTVSFGGVTSSISLPAEMSHAAVDPSERAARGLAPDLIRVAVGIEHEDDLVADLAAALDEACCLSRTR